MAADNHPKPSRTAGRSFTAKRMFEELEKFPQRTLIGVVKKNDEDLTIIDFSKDPSVEDFHTIPEGMVEDYEFVAVWRSGERQLPIVKLYLRKPVTPEEGAYFLADPGAGTAAPPTRLATATLVPRRFDAPAMAGVQSDCVFDADLGWIIRGTKIPCPIA